MSVKILNSSINLAGSVVVDYEVVLNEKCNDVSCFSQHDESALVSNLNNKLQVYNKEFQVLWIKIKMILQAHVVKDAVIYLPPKSSHLNKLIQMQFKLFLVL